MSSSDNELSDLCKSDDLSLHALQETINALGPQLSAQNQLCFHHACSNKNVTLEIVQLLHNTLPEALRLRDEDGDLPIHRLCCNIDSDESTSIDILRFMLDIYPTLREVDGYGDLPIHYAIKYKSTTFCKILIDAHPESLRIESSTVTLPIHAACTSDYRDDTADTIQYMLELDPELINAEKSDGYLPIHCAALYGRTKSIEILLKYDPDAASKETNNAHRRLPLHLSIRYCPNLSVVQVLYDAYPEAIFANDGNGNTPLNIAGSLFRDNQLAIHFLQTQLVYARQAQDMTAMTTVDDNGWLPLHHALKDYASLGSIKLLMRVNQAALHVADQNGAYPIHIACEFSSVDIVQLLVQHYGVALNHIDANNNSLLHYACRGGNCETIKYLLESHSPSVSERNNDNKLAIHLLFECGEDRLDRESMGYVETVWQLLLANPEVVRDLMP